MLLVQATDRHGDIAGESVYDAGQCSITIIETGDLIAARRARIHFRRLVAARLFQMEWDELNLHWDNQHYRIVTLQHDAVTEEKMIRAYRASWANAGIYQKDFTVEEAREIVRHLKSGFIVFEVAGSICGMVAGWPVSQTPKEEFAGLVRSPQRSTYLAEWSLTDSSSGSPYRGLGLGTFLLTIYLQSLLASGQSEVILVTAEKGYGDAQRNAARPLYESHGFRVCRDATGRPISRSVTQLRLDGQRGTHTSIYYRATAESIRMALVPESAPIDGFQMEVEIS